jgi:hypothetical protein
VVDPFRSVFDSFRIVLGRCPTSRNAPELLDAAFTIVKPAPPEVAPGAHVHLSPRTTNTGKAVWLAGRSADERGVVSLGWEWKREGKMVADSAARSDLHLDVFPGDAMDLDASAFAPDQPGHYELELSLAAEFKGQPARVIGAPLRAPMSVTPPAGASGSAP